MGASIEDRSRVAVENRKSWLIGSVAAVIAAVLGYAWIDGGREPLRPISEPLPLPEPPA
jgi:hypothetical protein